MVKSAFFLSFILVVTSCGKDDPVPADAFAGDYLLFEVLEEHNPATGDKFLAPEVFSITKTEFLDPTTGARVEAYKYEDDFRFIGMAATSSDVLIGTDSCPNESDLDAVSLTVSDSTYRLNMRNCEGREVLADYTKK